MFYKKRITKLEERIEFLENELSAVTLTVQAQADEIDRLHLLLVNQKPKEKKYYKPKTKKIIDGKENIEAAK